MRFADSALLLVDLQNDFCPGGALAVPGGDQIIPVVNRLLPQFAVIIAGQDWHPADHCSFRDQGGPWPPHCVQGTNGAALHPAVEQFRITHYVRKATQRDVEAYSEFSGVDAGGQRLDALLKAHAITALYVAGLATDYCVRATVLDGLRLGYRVIVVRDAIRAVEANTGDGARACAEMQRHGAQFVTSAELLHA